MNSAHNIMALIEALLADGGEIGIRELGAMTGIPKSTVQRFLSSMEENGWVKQDKRTQGYRIGYKLLAQSNAWMLRYELANQSRDLLNGLREATGQCAALSTLDASSGLWVASSVPPEMESLAAKHAQPFPLYATASGKALLAFANEPLRNFVVYSDLRPLAPQTITDPKALLSEIRRVRADGHAESSEEMIPGAAEIAVPLLNPDGSIFAALSVGGAKTDAQPRFPEYLERLNDAAAELNRRFQNL